MRMFNPPHPGLLIKEYIEGFESDVSVFAEKLGVARVTHSRIVNNFLQKISDYSPLVGGNLSPYEQNYQ